MPSSKTISKGVRLKNDVAEYFQGKPLNKYIEWLKGAIEEGIVEENEGDLVCRAKNTSIDSVHIPCMKEFMSYASLFKMTESEYIEKIKEAIDKGVLMEENGKFVGVCQYDLSVLEEKCKKSGMSVQSVINKMARMIG